MDFDKFYKSAKFFYAAPCIRFSEAMDARRIL